MRSRREVVAAPKKVPPEFKRDVVTVGRRGLQPITPTANASRALPERKESASGPLQPMTDWRGQRMRGLGGSEHWLERLPGFAVDVGELPCDRLEAVALCPVAAHDTLVL